MSALNWKPIETVPHDEFRLLYGYDISVADSWRSPADGIVLMRWIGPDADDPDSEGEWEIISIVDGLDVVYDPPPVVTHWAEFPTNVPPSTTPDRLSTEAGRAS